MDEQTLQTIAAQLRQPSGASGIQLGEKMNEGNLHINLNAIAALQPMAGDNILEIGMGNGHFVKDILQADSTITYAGCDFSDIMVAEASKRNELFISTGRAAFYVASGDKLPFANDSFSKVFTVNTLYFWDDREAVLAEIRRVLMPEGVLIIAIRPSSVMQHYPFVKYGFSMFSGDEVAALLEENGYSIIEVNEMAEPEVEFNGSKMQTATLLVIARKTGLK